VKHDQDLESLKSKYAQLDTRQANLNDQIDSLNRELEVLRVERRAREEEQRSLARSNRAAAGDEAKQSRSRLESFWIEQKNLLEKLKADRTAALEKATIFSRGRLQKEYDKKIEDQQARVDDAYTKFESFSTSGESAKLLANLDDEKARIQAEFNEKEQEIKQRINEATSRRDQTSETEEFKRRESERASIEDAFKKDSDRLQEEENRSMEAYNARVDNIERLQGELRGIEEKLIALDASINKAAQDNQVYRLAKLFSPEARTIADVPQDKVKLVAKIWFGSLALIIAITGILLAFASEVVKREPRRELKGGRGFGSPLASLSLAINRFVKAKPRVIYKTDVKEVIKEVPVEKIVFQEVVKEVVKKEIVHVPVYTNNKDILKRQEENGGE
jgi:hypothetical protein